MRFGLVFITTTLAFAAPDYVRDVAPILTARCGGCHSAEGKASGFSVAAQASVVAGGKKHGRAVVGGHPESSPLIQMIRGEVTPRMPMGQTLADGEVATLEAWVRSLPAEKLSAKQTWRWPYEKPAKPAVPAGARHPVDAFLLAKLGEKKLRYAPPADARTLARRVYFDLIGLPPTLAELEEFAADIRPDAVERLVDRLLADPRYGERWGRHWLDLARYGETSGLEGDGAIGNAWRYRDWVIEAFNQDMPYDRFVRLQLGGADEHSKTRNNYQPNVQGHVPLGFLRLAPWDRSNLVAAEVRANYLAELTASTSSVFLGLTVGCARCHDHKYDPIPQKDYYRFQAFFNTIQVEDVTVPYADPEFAATASKRIAEYEERLRTGPEQKELAECEKRLLPKLILGRKAAFDGKLTPADLRLELRRKDHRIFTLAETRRYDAIREDADRSLDAEERAALDAIEKEFLARLELAYAQPEIHPSDRFETLTVEDLRKEITNERSKIFRKADREEHAEKAEAVAVLRRRLARWQPVALSVKNVPGPPAGPDIAPIRILARGDYRQPGEPVEPGFLSAITGNQEPAAIESDRYRQFPTRGQRLTLAKWIASAENPLTARVMVNRIWQQHFGRGIVATTSDFGVNGERPTHPELLDWLAHRFVESGWSVKAMHRLLLTSAAYRQGGEHPGADEAADPENHLLWHFPRRRLEAEEIRDSVLLLSGRLSPQRGGPSVFPALPADLADFARYGRGGAAMWEPNERDEDGRRRSVYTFQRRSMPLPMMAAFDAPVFSESCERRSATTTPLQALSMMNGNLLHDEAEHLAERVGKGDRGEQIRGAFRLILQRDPTAAERDRFTAFSGGLDAICRILLNSNEFLYLD